MTARKPTLTKESVHYRHGDKLEHCGNCVMFHSSETLALSGTCDLVKGVILARMVCDKWEAIHAEHP